MFLEKTFESEKKEFDWEQDGFVIYRGLIPPEDVETYIKYMEETFFTQGIRSKDDAYLYHEKIRDFLCHPNIAEKCDELNIQTGIHANLLNWIYEHVGWHSDRMGQMKRNIGIFYALDYMPPESGRFAIYPGSHKWNLDLDKCIPGYRGETNEYLSNYLNNIIDEPYFFDGGKGDILIWNSNCIHRRSEKIGNVERKSAVTLCADEKRVQHKNGFSYCTSR